tara:strand:- start:428 stop:2851 length:2424 start_codon:yes stop_codon:yes gene_type:complete
MPVVVENVERLEIDPNKRPQEDAEKDDKSIIGTIVDRAGDFKDAVTGAGVPIEFPELPELTDLEDDSGGFFDEMVASQINFIRDDRGKAERISKIFRDDDRFGGVYEDKFGLPIVMWNDLPYYVNKPGLSEQDLNTFLGEIVKFLPANRIVSGGKTVLGTMARGAGAYSTTEALGQAGEAFLTPETTKAKDRTLRDVGEDIAVSTGIGMTADVLAPQVARAVGAGARTAGAKISEGARKLAEGVSPRLTPEVLQKSRYPLTIGQRTSPLPQGITPAKTEQLRREDELRYVDQGPGTMMVRGFDEAQLDQITADALSMMEEFGSGIPGLTDDLRQAPLDVAEQATSIVSGRAAALKEQAQANYDAVKSVDEQPFMTPENISASIEMVLNVLPERQFALSQLDYMPVLKSEITYLRRIRKLINKYPLFRDQPLSAIHGQQKRLKAAVKSAPPGSEEQSILIAMKDRLDEIVYDGVERGFIEGDQEVLDQLKSATGLYKDYLTLRGKGGGFNLNSADKTANRLLEQLSAENYTGPQVANFLFGHNQFNPNQAVPLVLDKLKNILPADEYARFTALLKDGILARAFTNKKGSVSRKAVVDNFDDVFKRQKAIINKLFSKDELARLTEFRDDVLPTVWAETKGNTSGTAYSLIGAAQIRQLLSKVPYFGKDLEESARFAEGMAKSRDALRQKIRSLQTPIFSRTTQAFIRSNLDEMGDEGKDLPELPAEERRELERQLQDIESQTPMVDENIGEEPLAMPSPPMQMPMFEPLPQTSGPMTASPTPPFPTILPSEEDREIAMRRRQGIAGLVA